MNDDSGTADRFTGDRERDVTQAFVGIANRLALGFDSVALMTRLTADCVRLLDVASAGLLLADARGALHILAASSEATRELELFQLQREQGPCLDCYRTGQPVRVPDLSEHAERWPAFVEAAAAIGFASVHALPMRLCEDVLGTLGLFGTSVGALDDDDLSLGQALADVASVALVQDRKITDKHLLADQLQHALNSRVVIEQAKGFVAQLGNLDMDNAFARLRHFARNHNQRLTDVARAVVSRQLPIELVLGEPVPRGSERSC